MRVNLKKKKRLSWRKNRRMENPIIRGARETMVAREYTLEHILEQAGYWAEPIHQALNYLKNPTADEKIGKFSYKMVDSQVRSILEHFKMFNSLEVYNFYKTQYEQIKSSKVYKSMIE